MTTTDGTDDLRKLLTQTVGLISFLEDHFKSVARRTESGQGERASEWVLEVLERWQEKADRILGGLSNPALKLIYETKNPREKIEIEKFYLELIEIIVKIDLRYEIAREYRDFMIETLASEHVSHEKLKAKLKTRRLN